MVDVAVPVYIEDIHMGNLFIGQFFLEPADRPFFARQAEEFGFERDSYMEALSKVPVLSMERIDHAIEFLANLKEIIGTTGWDKKRLFEWKNQLERRVQESTAELTYSNERLRVFSEASFEGILLSENGIVVEANEKIAAMLGFQRAEDLLGIKLTNFIAPENRKDVEDKISSGYGEPYESQGMKRDGTIFPIEVHGKTFAYQGRLARGSAIRDLTEQKSAQNEIQTLRNILPICSFCKKIRDDQGYWEQVDVYIRKHTETDFSHSICPECLEKHYPKR